MRRIGLNEPVLLKFYLSKEEFERLERLAKFKGFNDLGVFLRKMIADAELEYIQNG